MASPIKVSVDVDTREFDGKMKGFVKQVPFALSKSINATAQDATKALKKDVRNTFTIRGNQWVPKGVQMRASSKTKMVAEVGSVDDFMVKQVEGGEKKAKGGGNLGIPLVGKGRARPRKRSLTLPSDWPQALAAKDPDVFVGTAGRTASGDAKRKRRRRKGGRTLNSSKSGTFAVWRRLPKHRLKMVYAFKTEVTVPARWKLQEIVKRTVDQTWPSNVDRAIKYAIETARR